MQAIDVANWSIERANRDEVDESTGEGISNLKLQKILYFAQAAYLALNGKDSPLFEDDIVAWKYGPIVESVYKKLKANKAAPIKKPTDKSYLDTLDSEKIKFLEDVWELFGKYSAAKLVQLSHDHTPWKNAYARGAGTVITKPELYQYYNGLFQAS